MDSKKFIVISSGHVLPGYTVEQVGENLAKLYKKPSEKMIDMLVCGQSRKVKSVATRAQAQSKCAHLASLGLRCSFTEVGKEENDLPSMYTRASYMDESTGGDNANLPEPPEDIDGADVGDEPEHSEMFDEAIFDDVLAQAASGRLKKVMLVVVLPLLLIAGLAGVGHFMASTLFNSQVPVEVAEVESALYQANQPAVFMYANLAQIRRLASLGGHDQLHDGSTEAMLNTQFLQAFANNGYLLNYTDYVSASFDADSQPGDVKTQAKESGAWLTVLLGNFDAELVKQEFSNNYRLSDVSDGLLKLERTVKLVDGFSCPLDEQELKAQPPTYVNVGNSRVVFGNDISLLTKFVGSVERASDFSRTSNDANLLRWQAYREETLLATQFFTPDSIEQNMAATLAVNSIGGGSTFDAIGARVSTALLSRGVTVELDGFSSNARTLENARIKIERGIRNAIDESQEALPSIANLMSRLTVSSGDAVKVAMTLDSSVLKQGKALASDLVGSILGGVSVGGLQAPAQEQINKTTWDYTLNSRLLTSVIATNKTKRTYEPLFVKGDAQIYIESVGVKPPSPFSTGSNQTQSVQVTLKAKRPIQDLENPFSFSNSGVVQRLMITDVLNSSGEQLIADERCVESRMGEKKNQQASDDSNFSNSLLETKKTVRLKSGASIGEIDHLKGWYELSVPTKVEKIGLSMNSDREASWDGGSLSLKSINGGTVSYDVMGEDTNFLNIRGLNAEAKVLSSYSSVSGGNSHSKTFAGVVASIEVFVAREWTKDYFEFDLNSVVPKKSNEAAAFTGKDNVPLFSSSNRRNFSRALMLDWMTADERATIEKKLAWKGYSFDGSQSYELGRTRSKSVHVFLKHNTDNTWDNKLEGLLIVPLEQAILIGPKSLSLSLNINGKEYNDIEPIFSASSSNGEYLADFESSNRSYIFGGFSVALGDEQDKVEKVTGDVSYSLPTSISTSSVDLNEAEGGQAIKLHNIEYSDWSTKTSYLISKSVSNIYSAKLFTSDGGERRADVGVDSLGNTTLTFDSDQTHNKIELYRTKRAFEQRESFSLEPKYPE